MAGQLCSISSREKDYDKDGLLKSLKSNKNGKTPPTSDSKGR